ncbi:hypothetical protein HALLA_13455 [Halostagnicola larsenii XH-48]|uniref:Uncharacterized protein n=1 Tax=Halostagnicola larsenii XH-48 TaxID=797299 RepID=W0JQZ7_9EURY|nr:hypothetical protein [Halostagnicola larsenii]AHG01029.1 hypothetical protein HALLA_13455 [Halostagnicola larsenii XH-48]
MAPSLVHFLAGATLALFVATPLALRGHLTRRHLWIVAIGGLWGMFPDVNYATPVFQTELATLHGSRWANLFAAHHALDQPAFATRELLSTGAAVTGFVGAVACFTSASLVGEHGRRGSGSPWNHLLARALVTGYAAAVAGVVAAVGVGLVFTWAGRMETLAALWGRESAIAGWVFLLGCSLGASGVFGIVLEVLDRRWRVMSAVPGAGVGVVVAVMAWATVVAVAVPLWMRLVLDLSRPIPYFHRISLGALVVFGAMVGIVYPATRRAIDSPLAAYGH